MLVAKWSSKKAALAREAFALRHLHDVSSSGAAPSDEDEEGRAHLLPFYGFFEEGKRGCLVLGFAAGSDLAQWISDVTRSALPKNFTVTMPPAAAEMGDSDDVYFAEEKSVNIFLSARIVHNIARQMLQGLAYAHKRNTLHRDMKPDNMFVADDAGSAAARLMISQVLGADGVPALVVSERPHHAMRDGYVIGMASDGAADGSRQGPGASADGSSDIASSKNWPYVWIADFDHGRVLTASSSMLTLQKGHVSFRAPELEGTREVHMANQGGDYDGRVDVWAAALTIALFYFYGIKQPVTEDGKIDFSHGPPGIPDSFTQWASTTTHLGPAAVDTLPVPPYILLIKANEATNAAASDKKALKRAEADCEKLKHLLRKMLVRDYHHRLTAAECLQYGSDWLNERKTSAAATLLTRANSSVSEGGSAVTHSASSPGSTPFMARVDSASSSDTALSKRSLDSSLASPTAAPSPVLAAARAPASAPAPAPAAAAPVRLLDLSRSMAPARTASSAAKPLDDAAATSGFGEEVTTYYAPFVSREPRFEEKYEMQDEAEVSLIDRKIEG